MQRGITKSNRLEANSSPIAEPSVKAVSLKRNKMKKGKYAWASSLQIELDKLVWTDGSSTYYYYYHPINTSTECAIKKHHDLSGEPYYVVFWNGFGVVQSRDLDSLKKDVEQLVRIKKTKLWGK